MISFGSAYGQTHEWYTLQLDPDRTFTELSDVDYQGFKLMQSVSGIKISETITEKGTFTRIEATGYNYASEYGAPSLPVINRLIEIPRGADIELKVLSFNEQIIDLGSHGYHNHLYPYQPPVSKNMQEIRPEFIYNRNFYSQDDFTGYEFAKIEDMGIMRGRRIGRLRLSPVEYNAVTNQLRILSEITIEVIFRNIDSASEQDKGLYSSPFFESAFATKLLNYREDRRKSFFQGGPHKYIILSDPMFKEALGEFIEWKTRKGFDVIELYRGMEGVGETPSEMRTALAEIYHSAAPDDPAPVFLLIVGDHDQIPAFEASGHVTDLYYAEYDGDGDFFPDLFYGRFSANNIEELIPQINKTLIYEQYQFQDNDFLNNAVLIAGVDSRYAHIHGNGQINYGTGYYFNDDFGINSHAYLVPHENGAATDILEKISEGAGFVNYSGHGFPDRWDNPRFSIDDIASLGNYGKYSVMVGNGCETNKFNVYECLGEALLRAEDKGAVGYIGASNDSYWDEDFYWAVGVGPISANPVYEDSGLGAYDRIFHAGGIPVSEWFVSQGQIQHGGNLAVTGGATLSRSKYYWEIYHLMGDPSLMIYFSEPEPLTVDYQSIVAAGTTELVISTEPYTYVALSREDSLLDARYSDDNGIATLVFEPLQQDVEYNLMATRENRQPYSGSVMAAPSSQPFLSLESFIIDDSRHNNNGIAESGESVFLNLVVTNAGGHSVEDIILSLVCENDHISIYEPVYEITLLKSGEEVEIKGVFGFDISPEIPDGESLFFTLRTYSSDTLAWTSNFTMDVSAPEAEILRVWVDDKENGNTGGYLMAGETADIYVEFVNEGSAAIYDTEVLLTENSGGLMFHEGSCNHGTVNPGDTVYHQVPVTAGDLIEYGTILTVRMEIFSAEYISNNEFLFPVNTVYEDFEGGEFGRRPWKTDHERGWFHTSAESYSGRYALRSGEISHSDTSELKIKMEVVEQGIISFFHKVSSEKGYDFMEFYIDDERVGRWSGFINWSAAEFQAEPGNRVFRWLYVKDKSVSRGLDAAWIDNIIFPPGKLVSIFPHEAIVDVGVKKLITPEQDQWKRGFQPVTVSVNNYGNIAVSSFDMAYQIDDGSMITETIKESIEPGDSLDFTFSEEADLSLPGNYSLMICTMHPADTIYTNDTLYVVLNVPEVYDIRFAEIISPQSGVDLTDREILEVEIENSGNTELTGFELSYRLNDQEPVNEIFNEVLYPETVASYVFDQAMDLSLQGLYQLNIYILLNTGSKTINDSITVEIENVVTGIVPQEALDKRISIYPNPFDTYLYVVPENDSGYQEAVIRLFSVTGRLVHQFSLPVPSAGELLRISTGSLSPGIYYLEFSADDEKETYRVLKY